MGEKVDDGLGLSLSLGCGGNANNVASKPSVMAGRSYPMQFLRQPHQKPTHWNEIFRLSSDRTPAKIPAREFEEENGGSSPNSTVSSLSGKGSELVGEETEGERDSCSRGSDDEDGPGGDAARKKLRLTKEQALVLEETFKDHNTLNPKQKQALAKQLNLRPRQVEVWFQNRRARTKLKQTEVDCEYLKRCCENLTDENRRLQKEVQELRALKLSPQLYMQMTPPTTLTMCPSCERVSAGGPSRQPPPGRPGPVSPWAALSVPHRPADAPTTRS